MDRKIDAILSRGNPREIKLLYESLNIPLATFVPRPNNYHFDPDNPDEQEGFLNDHFPGIACVLGGTGSGKTMAGAAKVARFLLDTPPPRKNCPYWIVSQTLDMATSVCWAKHLSQFIPESYIAGYTWSSMAAGLPDRVILKKHANGNNWMIELRSGEQDRKRFQGSSIGGYWIDELIPYDVLVEIQGRIRDYNYPGSCFYTLTPLEPSPELEHIFYHQEQYPQWKIYRLNSECNKHLPAGYLDNYLAMELEERRETRRTGMFCSFSGVIYKSFNPKFHVVPKAPIPSDYHHIRGLDIGFSHATVCLWLAIDHQGRFIVYDEYYKKGGLIKEHIAAINSIPWGGSDGHFGHCYTDWGAAQERAEFAAQGLPTAPAKKDVLLGIAAVQNALKLGPDGLPGLTIQSHCENLIRELRTYAWHEKLDKPVRRDDDACDSLRYAIASHNHSILTPTAFRSSPPTRRIG